MRMAVCEGRRRQVDVKWCLRQYLGGSMLVGGLREGERGNGVLQSNTEEVTHGSCFRSTRPSTTCTGS